MKRAGPILAVLCVILVLWYLAAIWLNAAWIHDQAARAGVSVGWRDYVTGAMGQERPAKIAALRGASVQFIGIPKRS